MFVKIMTHTNRPLETLFMAIRTCYSPKNQEHILIEEFPFYEGKPAEGYPNDAVRLIAKVAALGHLSTLEHISFTFAIEGVSRSLLAQLTRHRIGFSYSVQSQRYVDLQSNSKSGGFDVVEPASIQSSHSAHNLFLETIKDIQARYDTLRNLGIPAEDARYILPNATCTNITLTCNLRAFLDFYGKRSDAHAQWEIRELSEAMFAEIKRVFPEIVYIIPEGKKEV